MAMSQKQKTLSTLAVIASLAAALASYAWFDVYQKGVADQKKKDAGNTLFSFKKDEVQKLVVTAKGEGTSLERDGASDWKITAPIQAAADKMPVDAIVDKLAGLKRLRGVDGASDLKEFGLAQPRIKIVLTLSNGKTAELDIGDDNPYDGTLFVKTGDSGDVDICEGALKYPLDKSLFDLREKRVFEFDDGELSHLDVVTPKLAYSLVRGSSTDWKIAAPLQAKADAAKSQQLAASLKNLKASRFATEIATADDLKKYGLDHAGFTVNVTLGKEAAQKTLVLTSVHEGSQDHVYVKRAAAPWIAEVPNSILKDLDLTVMDLLDKTVLDFQQQDAIALKFTVGNLTFGADRHRTKTDAGFGQDNWTMTAPALGDAKRWKASSILSTLETIKGATIVADNATQAQLVTYGLLQPEKTATVIGEGGKVLAELLVGKTESTKKVYVKSAASPRVYEVDSYRLTQLPANVTDLQDIPAKDGGITTTTAKR
jgi:hypothetical protein